MSVCVCVCVRSTLDQESRHVALLPTLVERGWETLEVTFLSVPIWHVGKIGWVLSEALPVPHHLSQYPT